MCLCTFQTALFSNFRALCIFTEFFFHHYQYLYFFLSLKKANTVVPAAANNLSGTSKRLLIDNGSGVLMYEDDVVSKEVKSAVCNQTFFVKINFTLHTGPENLKRSIQKLVKSNKSFFFLLREIAFLAALNFFPVQKLIFGHF